MNVCNELRQKIIVALARVPEKTSVRVANSSSDPWTSQTQNYTTIRNHKNEKENHNVRYSHKVMCVGVCVLVRKQTHTS